MREATQTTVTSICKLPIHICEKHLASVLRTEEECDHICSFWWCRGFTAFPRQDYAQWKKEGRLINDGVNAKVRAFPAVASLVHPCVLLLFSAGGIARQLSDTTSEPKT